MSNPRCTAVIASHRPSLISDLSKQLLRQNTSEDISFEVIIVCDYPHGILSQQFSDFIWVYLPDRSISRKRNAGVRIARGDIIAFIDDDCIPAENWILEGCIYMNNHPEISAVEGLTTIGTDSTVSPSATREYRRLEKPGFRTNNLFFRTAHFRALGGFDERFTVQREDIDLAFSAQKQGYRFSYCNTINVTHIFRTGEQWDLLKNCWNRRFDPLLFKKHPLQYLKRIGSPLPPTLALVLLFHGGLLASLKNRKTRILMGYCDVLLVTALGLRRSGFFPITPQKLFFELLQIAIAPIVIIAALIYGSIFLREKKQ